jgi:hypothetical protein
MHEGCRHCRQGKAGEEDETMDVRMCKLTDYVKSMVMKRSNLAAIIVDINQFRYVQ